jgi:hypothetical protein
MTQSFGIVEEKLFETEFFLESLRLAKEKRFEARCYFSAFVSAARSVTFVLQATLNGVHGFAEWYENVRNTLKADAFAPYFIDVRNDLVHKGVNPLNAVSLVHLHDYLSRQFGGDHSHVLVIPSSGTPCGSEITDAIGACQGYFASLVAIIFDCYDRFRTVVDPRWYFTLENFTARGKTLEDAINELGFPPDWASSCPLEIGDALQLLRRQQPCCQLNELFQRYLGRQIPDPDG